MAHSNKDVPIRIHRERFLSLQSMAGRRGLSQREYVDRVFRCLSVIASRSGTTEADPLNLLEQLVGIIPDGDSRP